MKVVIVDDEQDAVEYLSSTLERLTEFNFDVSTATSIQSAIEIINAIRPDFVLLDVNMPHGSGFDVLKGTEEIDYEVIFTTAYDEYALKAIKFNAFDYLLKPVDIDELREVIVRLDEGRAKSMKFSSIEDNISTISKLAIPYKSGFMYIHLDDFLYIAADGSYSTIFTTTNKYVVSRRIKYFEELLSDSHFCRIHASYIVNLKQLKQFSRSNGGEVTLENGTVLSVSKNRRNDLLNRINSI